MESGKQSKRIEREFNAKWSLSSYTYLLGLSTLAVWQPCRSKANSRLDTLKKKFYIFYAISNNNFISLCFPGANVA